MPRTPRLPAKPRIIGGRATLHNEAYHGKFTKVRMRLKPEDVLAQSGSATETEASNGRRGTGRKTG